MTFTVTPIGHVESPLVDLTSAPRQGDEGAPDAWIVVRDDLLPALDGVHVGDRVIVLTWLDRADRDTVQVVPRGEATRAPQGVFSTRSPDRPNPIGLHEVELLDVVGTRLHVRGLEAIDGTPVLDLKPVLGPVADR